MHSRACAVDKPYAARSNKGHHCVPPGGDGLRRWENQRMLTSCLKILLSLSKSVGIYVTLQLQASASNKRKFTLQFGIVLGDRYE